MSKMYRLPSADRQIYFSGTPGSLGGNGQMKIYGHLNCAPAMRAVAAGNTYQKHRVFFADEATVAIRIGHHSLAVDPAIVSAHAGTATLDAGSKAISPDKPMSERFRWPGKIIFDERGAHRG
jgi:hypothetical protein